MWPFRKSPPPPSAPPRIDDTGFNYDWQIGDLAKCVDANWTEDSSWNPKRGDVLKVSALVPIGNSSCGRKTLSGLRFEGKPETKAWWCGQFVKAAKDSATTEVEEGIIAKIKRAAKQGADA